MTNDLRLSLQEATSSAQQVGDGYLGEARTASHRRYTEGDWHGTQSSALPTIRALWSTWSLVRYRLAIGQVARSCFACLVVPASSRPTPS